MGCMKRKTECRYALETLGSPSPALQPDWSSAVINASANTTVSPATQSALSPDTLASDGTLKYIMEPKTIGQFDMEDMALWHQFVKHTAGTLPNPWGEDLPQEALSCEYLMHGILATGALHLAHLYPDKRERYNYLAAQHQDLALGPFQREMRNITSKNGSNLFAFSTLLVVFNYVLYKSSEFILPFGDGGLYSGPASWMLCLRGCRSILVTAKTHVEAGPLGFLIRAGKEVDDGLENLSSPSSEDEYSLVKVTDIVLNLRSIKSSTTVEEMESYTDAIRRLRNLLTACERDMETTIKRASTSIWPVTISDTFIRLLTEKRPPALIIMAYYCVLLKKVDSNWYTEGRGLNLLEGVQQSLGQDWMIYIERPLQVYGRSL